MKRKLYLLRAVKILCLVLVIAVTVGLLQEYLLCHADHNRQRIKGFYEEERDSLDVVYLGASEVYSDIAPGYMYKRDGITGYLFATQSNSILNYKAQLKNILSRQKPSLIVIELNGALYGDEEEVTKDANLHNYADNVPLDFTKLEWVFENGGANKAEYIFPIMKFHTLWSDLKAEKLYRDTISENHKRGYNYLKGILNETTVFQSTQRSMNSALSETDSKAPLTQIEEKGLRDLLQFCKDEGLTNVVFARFPHIVVKRTFSRFERSNTVGEIVKEYGFDYLNFERDFAKTGLSEETDFYNLDHLNVYGQRKFTEYITDYLKEHYSLAPHTLSESQAAEWNACADYYDAYCAYSEEMINKGERVELSEDNDLINTLSSYLNK